MVNVNLVGGKLVALALADGDEGPVVSHELLGVRQRNWHWSSHKLSLGVDLLPHYLITRLVVHRTPVDNPLAKRSPLTIISLVGTLISKVQLQAVFKYIHLGGCQCGHLLFIIVYVLTVE